MRLLYLHGVGDDGTRRDWWNVLRSVAGDPLDHVDILAPDYGDLLDGSTPPGEMAGSGGHHHLAFPHLQARRAYRSRQAALYADLRTAGASAVWPYRRRGFGRVPDALDALGEKVVMDLVYAEVNRYTRNEEVRRAVRARVTELLPQSGPVIVLGHSLGALVAIDLLRHLPDGIDVPLLVTAASALARRRLPDIVAELPHTFPSERVGGWINVFNPADAVTRGRPIGMRFPQAVDVVAAGSLGDHSLATCVTTPGVAAVLIDHLQGGAAVHHAHALHGDGDPLPLGTSTELVTWLLVHHIGELAALEPGIRPDSLNRFEAARQLTVLRAARRSGDSCIHQGADPARLLHDRLAESNLPAVLVRLATEDPLERLSVSAPPAVVSEARRRAAADIGVPPDWIELARDCAADGAAGLKRRRRRGGLTGSPEAPGVTDAIAVSLAPMGLLTTVDHRSDTSAGDLTAACRELVARALVADRLGQPDPGTEERAALNRLLLLLSDARRAVGADEPLMAQLRALAQSVADGLAFLTHRGLGTAHGR